jgi:hypothetical protein
LCAIPVFLLLSVGFADRLRLSDLRGLSIDASVDRVEQFKDIAIETSNYSSTSTYQTQIYVSPTGRVFERLGFSTGRTYGQYDAVSTKDTKRLRFIDNFGFRRVSFDGGAKTPSTYIMITSIAIHRDGTDLKCDASMEYVLKSGETQYIKPVWNGKTYLVLSWKFENPKCVVQPGNIFVGQSPVSDCQPFFHRVENASGGFVCTKN